MTINQIRNQKHRGNANGAFMGWWESSGNLKGKVGRGVLPEETLAEGELTTGGGRRSRWGGVAGSRR